jgi:peptide deformylase
MLLNIIIEPNEILHQKTQELAQDKINTPEIRKLIKNMIETMNVKDGVGLAGSQVNVPLAICVIHKNFTLDKKEDLVLINPIWEKMSIIKEWEEEGCLSVPGIWGKVKRYKKIKVKAFNQKGEPLKFIADKYLARIIQHEVDHLNGILFISKAKNLRSATNESNL